MFFYFFILLSRAFTGEHDQKKRLGRNAMERVAAGRSTADSLAFAPAKTPEAAVGSIVSA